MSSPAQQDITKRVPITLPVADEVYRTIMGQIEPELLLPEAELQAKYADETEADGVARSVRYDKAFAEYDRQYARYMQDLTADASTYVKQGVVALEQKDQEHEQNDIADIESAISNS